MIIAFCGMEKEGAEPSINMIAAALAIIQLRKKQVILVESGFGRHIVQNAVDKRVETMVREPFAYAEAEGMDYLLKRSQYQQLNESNVKEGVVFVTEKLGYVPSAMRKNRILYEEEFCAECQNILKMLDQTVDFVMVDCTNVAEQIRRRVEEKAQLIIVNVSQSERMLDEYFSTPELFRGKAMYCIGNYIREEPCNLKNIQRLYRIENQNIGVLPYNTEFLSSLNRGKVLQFFAEHPMKARRLRNKEFFNESFRLADQILRKEDIHEKQNEKNRT